MKPAVFGSIFALAVFASMAGASDQLVLDLWPGTAPGETGEALEEKSTVETWGRSLTNITKPTLIVYRPAKETDTGAALIIAPGGAFRFLAIEHEGDNVAQWCNTIGEPASCSSTGCRAARTTRKRLCKTGSERSAWFGARPKNGASIRIASA